VARLDERTREEDHYLKVANFDEQIMISRRDSFNSDKGTQRYQCETDLFSMQNNRNCWENDFEFERRRASNS